MKNSEGNGKLTRWLIYVRIHVYTYICVQKVSSFRLPVTFDLQLQTRSGFETEQGKKQKNQRFGGLQGVKFKFVITHVQVCIKLLQLVQLSRQPDRIRAGQAPLQFSK